MRCSPRVCRRLVALGIAWMAAALIPVNVHATTSCEAQRWTTAISTVQSDLKASPPLVIDARLDLEDLAANSEVSGSDAVLQPVITDLKAHPARLADAGARANAIAAFLPASSNDCVVDLSGAKSKLNDVYASPVFQNLDQKQNDFLQQLGQRVTDFLSSVFSHIGTGGTVAVLAALAAILLWLLIRAWRRVSAGRKTSVETGEPAATSDPDFEWKAAETAAARGDYREAVRRAFRSALLHVAYRGRLQVDPAWTNRELLSRASGDAALLTSLAPAAHTFENCWYGNERATESTWVAERQRCQAIIKLSRKPVEVS